MVTSAMTELMEKVAASPVGVKALKEMEIDRLARREKLVDSIAAIRAKAEAEQPKLQKAVSDAMQKVETALESVVTARQEFAVAQAAASNPTASRQIVRLEGELLDTADKETIRAFTTELDVLHDQVRGGLYTRRQTTERRIDGKDYLKDPGNAAEVTACLSQIGEARREARGLVPLEPLTKDALGDRLQALREDIKLP